MYNVKANIIHRQLVKKLRGEYILHAFGVALFVMLAVTECIPIVKGKYSVETNIKKISVLVFGALYILVFASAALCLKYIGLKRFDERLCKIWTYLEMTNILLLTAFIIVATNFLFPPPFHTLTGASLLFLIYWLPLVIYQFSQILEMRIYLRNIEQDTSSI